MTARRVPVGVPDRESLVLALMQAQYAWENADPTRRGSLLQYLTDAVVLPLVTESRRRPLTNEVSGTVTGDVIQTGDVDGEVQL